MSNAAKTLLILGFVIGLLQVGSIGLMLFDGGLTPLALAIKVALFACIGWFAVTAVGMIRRA